MTYIVILYRIGNILVCLMVEKLYVFTFLNEISKYLTLLLSLFLFQTVICFSVIKSINYHENLIF